MEWLYSYPPVPAIAHKIDDLSKCSGTIFQTQHVAHPNKKKINSASKNRIYAT